MGLDTFEFFLYAEKAFDIKITNEEAASVYSVGDFSALCYQKLRLKSNNPTDESEVFLKLKLILHQHFVNANNEINRNRLIVKDLGLV